MLKRPNNIRDPKLKVQQHHAATASAAAIMARHSRGPQGQAGVVPQDPAATNQPNFAYMPSEHYHDMMNKVADIKSRFAALPARTRSTFQNEPYQWLRFCENPKNRDVCLKNGWVTMTDAEFDAQSQKAEDERLQRILEGVKPVSAPGSDDEAQPNRGSGGAAGASNPPPKGGVKG